MVHSPHDSTNLGDDGNDGPFLMESVISEDLPSTQEDASEGGKKRKKVVVIGCGPGGMFFLHALATKRMKLQEAGDEEGLAAFPEVTVYEKASGPGGVWRARSESTRRGSTEMFGGLWTNSPSFEMEFFDYTYQEHFNESMPLYLPRKKLLDYMLARVTQNEDIFQHVKFNTHVDWVEYDKESKKFLVDTLDLKTGVSSKEEEFDMCVWAGGENSIPYLPMSIREMLMEGNYQGEAFHSSEMANDFDSHAQGKRILLVGDSYSAEDLALQALKMGAEHVYITSPNQGGAASRTTTWPGNKVTNLRCLPSAVTEDGWGLHCSKVRHDENGVYKYVPVKEEGYFVLPEIDAVVYCTGYRASMYYMAPELQNSFYSSEKWSTPKDWSSQNNSLTRDLGEVEPNDVIWGSDFVGDYLYRHHLIDNPNMMYIGVLTDFYFQEIDAMAWALAAYVRGEMVLPSKEEMLRRNAMDKLEAMNIPYYRSEMDPNYYLVLQKLRKRGHWSTRSVENRQKGYAEYYKEFARYHYRLIARDQVAGGHGGGFGTYEKLSPRGELGVSQHEEDEWSRDFPIVENETEWRTFRDRDPAPFKSLYTGTMFAPLKTHWMDLDDDGNPLSDLSNEHEHVLLGCEPNFNGLAPI